MSPKLWSLLHKLATGNERWPLFLHGPCGSGKSLASLCLCDISETAIFKTVEELCETTVRRDDQFAKDLLWRNVAEKGMAVLDEIGTRKVIGDLEYSVVKRFADAREINAQRVAIYISNVSPEAIAGLYDDRIASRLLCGACFELDGDDRRYDK